MLSKCYLEITQTCFINGGPVSLNEGRERERKKKKERTRKKGRKKEKFPGLDLKPMLVPVGNLVLNNELCLFVYG